MTTGSCLCGAVRLRIDAPLAAIQLCHCGQCRKAQGSAFAANMPVAEADLAILSGADRLKAFESSPGKERVFCADCGSPIFSRLKSKPGVVRIRAGVLDAPVPARPAFHFHTASQADWWEITDDLPRYPGAKPD